MKAVWTKIHKFLMERKTNELLKQATEIMGQEADIIIIAHKNGQCGAVTHGSTDNIAQAIFSCMHQPNNPIGQAIYRIIKLNVMNMLANPSPYAVDLTESITNILPEDDE